MIPGLNISSSVSVERFRGQCTVWSIVYDMTNLGVFFKTHEDPCIRSVRVRDFDFSSDRPALALDLTRNSAGDVSGQFVECTTKINK